MACPVQANNPQTTSGRGFIYDTLVRIDQMQKAATIQTACEGCEGSLISAYYNTKPIQIYLCSGVKLAVDIPESLGLTTTVFRIETVKTDAVVLRLLQALDGTTTCTNYTVIVNIDCICCLQCLAPICCDPCTKVCGVN